MESWAILALVAVAASAAMRSFDKQRRRAKSAVVKVEEVSRQAAIERARLDQLECAVEEYISRQRVQEAKCHTKPRSS